MRGDSFLCKWVRSFAESIFQADTESSNGSNLGWAIPTRVPHAEQGDQVSREAEGGDAGENECRFVER